MRGGKTYTTQNNYIMTLYVVKLKSKIIVQIVNKIGERSEQGGTYYVLKVSVHFLNFRVTIEHA